MNNKKIVLELGIEEPVTAGNPPNSTSSSVYLNNQIIFSDIFLQANDKETKIRFVKKEKDIIFKYEQENIIKLDFTYQNVHENIREDTSFETHILSMKNNNSSPINLYDINYNVSEINKKMTRHETVNAKNTEYYINDTLLISTPVIEFSTFNNSCFKQISLNVDENITFYNKCANFFSFKIKIQNI